jgi:tRNA threonylcarbamoyladenosine biosynthesis protein TsaE
MDIFFGLDELNSAAGWLLEKAGPHSVIAFHGAMGAGKTTLIHALCHRLGVQDAVSSPTYSLINQYRSGDGSPVYHLDLYRLSGEEEALQAGVEDCLYSGSRCFVEWPEKAPGLLPAEALHVQLDIVENLTRKLSIIV